MVTPVAPDASPAPSRSATGRRCPARPSSSACSGSTRPRTYARSALVNALQQRGVQVGAPAVATNPASLLPKSTTYPLTTRVAAYPSAPFAQEARLILKVSLNLGANLALTKFGLAHGVQHAHRRAGARASRIGGDGRARSLLRLSPPTAAAAPTARLRRAVWWRCSRAMSRTPVAAAYRTGLPLLGVDGSLTTIGTRLAARGHVWGKTGTTAEGGTLVAQTLAGYVDAPQRPSHRLRDHPQRPVAADGPGPDRRRPSGRGRHHRRPLPILVTSRTGARPGTHRRLFHTPGDAVSVHSFGSRMRLACVVVAALAAAAACDGSSGGSAGKSAGTASPSTSSTAVPKDILAVMGKAKYAHSRWGLAVRDLDTGKMLVDLAANQYFPPGSTTKVFTGISTWNALKPDHRFVTPVYAKGNGARPHTRRLARGRRPGRPRLRRPREEGRHSRFPRLRPHGGQHRPGHGHPDAREPARRDRHSRRADREERGHGT